MKNPFSCLLSKLFRPNPNHIDVNKRFERLEELIQQLNSQIINKEDFSHFAEFLHNDFKRLEKLIQQLNSQIINKEHLCHIDTIIEKFQADINARFDSIDKKVSKCESGSMKDIIEDQHKQISDLHSDMFYRMMRQYIFDTYVHLYKVTAYDLFEHNGDNNLKTILMNIEAEMKNIGISFVTSTQNTPFNSQQMEISKYPPIPTNNKALNRCVAKTIVPLLEWKITSNNKSHEIPLQREEVILYSASNGTTAEDLPQSAQCITQSLIPEAPISPSDQTQIITPTGFLIQCRGDNVKDITCLYPILPGKNIVGTAVKKGDDSAAAICHLSVPQKNNEPFTVIINNEEDRFSAKVTHGKWGINSIENHHDSYELSNRDTLYINEVKFIFISVI